MNTLSSINANQKIRLALSCMLFLGSLVFISSLGSQKVSAAYDGGRLIDNSVFLDAKSMTKEDVQAFLVSKGGQIASRSFLVNCDSAGTQAKQIYTSLGAPCGQLAPASHIIYYSAQVYGINPRVVLSTIQKEQSLVTAPNPIDRQYAQAMGYACPTSGSCSDTSNFFWQIDNGTWVMRLHYERARGNNDWWYPSSSWVCGTAKNLYKPSLYPGQNVNFYDEDGVLYRTHYIVNAATSSLYCYTPHAYNNPQGLYGRPPYGTVGRYYSGSYNFVYYFELWFGSTAGTPFFQLPGSVKTYMIGANNSYYYVADYETLRNYGFEGAFKQRVQQVPSAYISDKSFKGNLPPIARFEGIGVFLADNGSLHAFPSEDIFYGFGYSFGQEALLPEWVQQDLNETNPVQQVVKSTQGTYLVENGKKRAFCSAEAFTSLGAPTYNTRPSISLSTTYLNRIPNGPLVASDGDIIYSSQEKAYGVWQAGTFYPFNYDVARNMKTINCSIDGSVQSQLPTSSTNISNLVKDSVGNLFIIDANRKLSITSIQAAAHGLAQPQFIDVNNNFLSKLSLSSLPSLIRIDNGMGVYLLQNGKRYGIPTEADFNGLGYSFTNVKSITSKTSSLFGDNGLIFRPGRVVRIGTDKGVFLLGDGFKKYPFTTEGTFLGYGYNWKDVLSVDSSWIRGYSTSSYVNRYTKDDQSNYWIIDSTKRRLIPPTLADAAYFNIEASSPTPVNNYILGLTVRSGDMTKVFRAGSDKAVYLIENGKKRGFTSESAFFSRGFTWSDVISVSHEYVNSLPSGSLIY